MGLDTYAGRHPEDPDLPEQEWDSRFGCTDADLRAFRRAQKKRERLRGGYCVFAGNHFRGKIYNDLVERVTGVSLYEWWIPPETVKEMSDAFEHYDPSRSRGGMRRRSLKWIPPTRYSLATVGDLQEFFRVCARRGLGLVGSQ